jgi:hypothetical protein
MNIAIKRPDRFIATWKSASRRRSNLRGNLTLNVRRADLIKSSEALELNFRLTFINRREKGI